MDLLLFFLMQFVTRERKGKIHPPITRRGKKIYTYLKQRQRWTDRTKTTERLNQTARHKRETEREKVRQHIGMNWMPWTQLSLPHLLQLSFLSLTADDNPHPVSASITSITRGPDTVTRLWAPYQTSTLECVELIGCVTPWVCACLCVCKCLCVC